MRGTVLAFGLLALLGRAAGLDGQSVAALRSAVARGIGEGKVTSAFVDFGGTPARITLKSADAACIEGEIAGTPVSAAWDEIDPKRFAALASRCVASGAEYWALALLYSELGQQNEADEAFAKAAELDPVFKDKLTALRSPPPEAKPQATPTGAGAPPVLIASPPQAPTNAALPDTALTYPPFKGATPPRGLRTDRPRLLVTEERLQFLRQAGRNTPSYGGMRTWCRSNPNGAYYAPMQALVYVVENAEDFGRMAIDNVMKNVVRRGVNKDLNSCFGDMGAAALVYDWCHPLLSDDEKKAFIKYMVEEYDAMANTYRGLHYHNYNCAPTYAFSLAGYALHGDDPKSAEMIRNAVRDRFEGGILPEAFMKGNAGGAWAEGEGYSYTTVPDLIWTAEAARTCEGINYFDDPRGRSFFYNRLAYMMFATYPGKHGAAEMLFYVRGDGVRYGNTLDARAQLLSLAYAYSGSRLAAYARDFVEKGGYAQAPYRDGLWHDVIWAAPGAARLPIEDFRLSHHARGMGVVLMKSDWTADAAFVSFICGDHYSYHQHADSGSFTIVRYGQELAVDSGEYDGSGGSEHAANYHSRTIAHNSICLAGYEKSEMRARRVGPADDGGQPIGKTESFRETGNIIAYDPQRAYTYVVGDVTDSFGGRLSSWIRHVLFIRPEIVIICDFVSAPPKNYPRWLLHTWNEPEIAGAAFRAEKGAGALIGRVLLPVQHNIEKIGGDGKDFWVANRNYPPPGRSDTARWRIEVTPTAPAQGTVFLVVMQAAKNSVKEALPAALLTDGSVGCTIGGSVTVRFGPNGAPGGTLAIGGQTFNLATTVLADTVE